MTGKTTAAQFVLTVVLRDGTEHSFTVEKMPRHYASWIMRQLPYDTDFFGAEFSRARVNDDDPTRKDR